MEEQQLVPAASSTAASSSADTAVINISHPAKQATSQALGASPPILSQQRVSGRCIKRLRRDGDLCSSAGNNWSACNSDANNHNTATGPNTSSPKMCISRRLQQQQQQQQQQLDTGAITSSPKAAATATQERTRRPWDLWTAEFKDWFFDALCEYGKDFDAIYKSMRMKSRKCRTQQGEIGAFKRKDQVRYFYYRTWHKVSKALGDSIGFPELKKNVQELYGLINFSEMRKKVGSEALNSTNAPRLLELVTTGQTTIKVKGKNFRVKTPVCRALRLINNVPDRAWEGPKIPAQITLELRPIDNAAWTHVQALAQNPRVRVICGPQRRVASVVVLMEDRWQPTHARKKASLLAVVEGLKDTPTELKNSLLQFTTASDRLRLRVFPNSPLKEIQYSPADSYCNADVCLNSYLTRIGRLEDMSQSLASPSTINPSLGKTQGLLPLISQTDGAGKLPVEVQQPIKACSQPDSASVNGTPKTDYAAKNSKVELGSSQKKACDAKTSNADSSQSLKQPPPFSSLLGVSAGSAGTIVESNGVKHDRRSPVSALVNEEANDGLSSAAREFGDIAASSNLVGCDDNAGGNRVVTSAVGPGPEGTDGPVGEGWTAESLGVLTVGDLYLRLGGSTSGIVLYYQFEGANYPAPENRTTSMLDRLITVLLGSVQDKKAQQNVGSVSSSSGNVGRISSTCGCAAAEEQVPQSNRQFTSVSSSISTTTNLVQTSLASEESTALGTGSTQVVNTTVSSQSSKPRRERLLERAASDLNSKTTISIACTADTFRGPHSNGEFVVPSGHAPRALSTSYKKKDTVITPDLIRIELPPGNRRNRVRRKPISAIVLQRPLVPRVYTAPVSTSASLHSGAVKPGDSSMPSGVVVRNILPTGGVATMPIAHVLSPSLPSVAVSSVSVSDPCQTASEQHAMRSETNPCRAEDATVSEISNLPAPSFETESSLDRLITAPLIGEGVSLEQMIVSSISKDVPLSINPCVQADSGGKLIRSGGVLNASASKTTTSTLDTFGETLQPNGLQQVSLGQSEATFIAQPSSQQMHSTNQLGTNICKPLTSGSVSLAAKAAIRNLETNLETPKKVSIRDTESATVAEHSLDDLSPSVALPSLSTSSVDLAALVCTPTKSQQQNWLTSDVSNNSLSSLFCLLDSPLRPNSVSGIQSSSLLLADSNSSLDSRLPDVDSHFQSLMNESSIDYISKFADLAAQITHQGTNPGSDYVAPTSSNPEADIDQK